MSDILKLLAAIPRSELERIVAEAVEAYPEFRRNLELVALARPPPVQDWDDFHDAVPRYYRAISTQPADVQLEMLEELLAKVVLDERSAYNHQLMHILADPAREWPKFYQPWYVNSQTRTLSSFAEMVGDSAQDLPFVLTSRMYELAQTVQLGEKKWAALARRCGTYKTLLSGCPYYFAGLDALTGLCDLATAKTKAAMAVKRAKGDGGSPPKRARTVAEEWLK